MPPIPQRTAGSGSHQWLVCMLLWVLAGSTTVRSQCITNFPYEEGFEGGPAWTTGGYLSDWEWGTPAHPLINSAASGTKAWCVGGLEGTFYNEGQQSWLEGPCFNFTNVEYPWISFKIFWEVERTWDGLGFQSSVDMGATWQNVGSSTGPQHCMDQNWFNTSSIPTLNLAAPKEGWSGRVGATQGPCLGGSGSEEWVTASHCLLDFAGMPNVRFRFIFGAGNTCNSYDGVAIDDIYIGEAPENQASFNLACQGNVVSFQNNSLHCPNSFFWDFGDPPSGAANTGSGAAVSHVYETPGTYTVTLTVNGPCNATSSTTRTITVAQVELVEQHPGCAGNDGSLTAVVDPPGVVANFLWDPPAPNTPTITGLSEGYYILIFAGDGVCPLTLTTNLYQEESPFQLIMDHADISCAGAADGWASVAVEGVVAGLVYEWSPGNGATATIPVTSGGEYTVTVTAEGCSGTASVQVNEPLPLVATASPTLSLCAGSSIPITPSVTGGNAPYIISYDPSGPVVSPQETTTYTMEVVDQQGCTAPQVQTTVEVGGPQTPQIGVTIPTGCAPHCTTLSGIGNGTLTWQLGDGTVASGNSISHCFGPGSHDIILTVTDGLGCTNSTEAAGAVQVEESPVSSFSVFPTVTTIERPEIRFHQHGSGASAWLWHFDDADSTVSNDLSPIFSYREVGCFNVMLIVSNAAGCSDSSQVQVCVEDEFVVFSPNAFTPNDDGLNDVFLPWTSVREPGNYELSIYDRWGSMVYSTTDHMQGWDGTSQGRELPSGIFIWALRIRDTLDALQEKQGHVMLVR